MKKFVLTYKINLYGEFITFADHVEDAIDQFRSLEVDQLIDESREMSSGEIKILDLYNALD